MDKSARLIELEAALVGLEDQLVAALADKRRAKNDLRVAADRVLSALRDRDPVKAEVDRLVAELSDNVQGIGG